MASLDRFQEKSKNTGQASILKAADRARTGGFGPRPSCQKLRFTTTCTDAAWLLACTIVADYIACRPISQRAQSQATCNMHARDFIDSEPGRALEGTPLSQFWHGQENCMLQPPQRRGRDGPRRPVQGVVGGMRGIRDAHCRRSGLLRGIRSVHHSVSGTCHVCTHSPGTHMNPLCAFRAYTVHACIPLASPMSISQCVTVSRSSYIFSCGLLLLFLATLT